MRAGRSRRQVARKVSRHGHRDRRDSRSRPGSTSSPPGRGRHSRPAPRTTSGSTNGHRSLGRVSRPSRRGSSRQHPNRGRPNPLLSHRPHRHRPHRHRPLSRRPGRRRNSPAPGLRVRRRGSGPVARPARRARSSPGRPRARHRAAATPPRSDPRWGRRPVDSPAADRTSVDSRPVEMLRVGPSRGRGRPDSIRAMRAPDRTHGLVRRRPVPVGPVPVDPVPVGLLPVGLLRVGPVPVGPAARVRGTGLGTSPTNRPLTSRTLGSPRTRQVTTVRGLRRIRTGLATCRRAGSSRRRCGPGSRLPVHRSISRAERSVRRRSTTRRRR